MSERGKSTVRDPVDTRLWKPPNHQARPHRFDVRRTNHHPEQSARHRTGWRFRPTLPIVVRRG